jgi:capsule biosynthesis phosphatase
MNIVIPIGGVGQRFKDAGYQFPKPLINVLGKPMLYHVIKNLKVDNTDTIWIIYNNDLKEFNFESLIKFYFPKLNIKMKSLNCVTKGAVDTVMHLLNDFNQSDLFQPLLLVDCDTFYTDDVIGKYKSANNKNVVFYFNDSSVTPIYSYIETSEFGNVLNIKEKQKISDKANTGAYGFESANLFIKYALKIQKNNFELYTSYVYHEMIKDNVDVFSIKVDNFNCVGTPIQLESFCCKNAENSDKLRICFDIDNTLVTYPQIAGDYTSVLPINKTINFLKLLKSFGHTIILYTARRMKTHNGNVGAVIADISDVTISTLKKYDIPYDELHFGKPYANFYIDDLAVNPYIAMEKSIGILNAYTNPRSFNKIEFVTDKICKTTSNNGEIFFYKNLPDSISKYFPKVYEIHQNKIYMENIEGMTYSYYYINKLLTIEDLEVLLNTINDLHTSVTEIEFNATENYVPKMTERYLNNLELYESFAGTNLMFEHISKKLKHYINKKACIIHGDLVFTNVLKTKKELKFIDMRGKVGNILTCYGDAYYDYAKIYQSIIGYDFILNDVEIDNHYIDPFVKYFESKCSIEEIKIIKLITASLLFSMLPLHDFSKNKFEKYINLIKKLISDNE